MKNELGRKWGKTYYGKLYSLILQPTLKDITVYALLIQRHFTFPSWLSTYPSCFHFIPRGAAPSFPIRKNFTLLSLKTWLHMTPPFLLHYGSYRRQKIDAMFSIGFVHSLGAHLKKKPSIFPITGLTVFQGPPLFFFFFSKRAKSRFSEQNNYFNFTLLW